MYGIKIFHQKRKLHTDGKGVEWNVILWNATAILNEKKADDSKFKTENGKFVCVQCAALVFTKKSERGIWMEWSFYCCFNLYNKDFNSSPLSGCTPSEMAYLPNRDLSGSSSWFRHRWQLVKPWPSFPAEISIVITYMT